MAKKKRLTKIGRFFDETKPLATRSILLPPSRTPPGRMPFFRLGRYGPTEKLGESGHDN
jgi:hypothetical protein